MAGLINNALTGTEEKDLLAPDKTLQANAIGFDPEKRTVNANETVAGQLDSVLAKDSPVLQRARSSAAGVANSRGLLNSSMATQAGEAAVIDAAMPIASQDASTFSAAARDNQVAGNTALAMNADATNKAAALNTDAANRVALTRLDAQSQQALQTLRGDQAKVLAEIEANYKQLMQANSSTAAVFNESMGQIATILRDPSTSAEQKESAVSSVNALLQSSLAVSGAISNLDLGALLNFSGGTPVPA